MAPQGLGREGAADPRLDPLCVQVCKGHHASKWPLVAQQPSFVGWRTVLTRVSYLS